MANPFPFSSGDVLTAANLNSIGERTAYTPALNFASQGNGTVEANYARVNDIVVFRFRFILGSTSTISAGFRPGLPVNAYVPSTTFTGFVEVEDTSTGRIFFGGYVPYDGGGNARPYIWTDLASAGYQYGYQYVSNTVPFTFSTGDSILISGAYLAQ